MEYTLIRSDRKSLGMQIKGTEVIVRAPFSEPQSRIDAFVRENAEWAERNLKKAEERQEKADSLGPLTPEEIERLAKIARDYIPRRAELYARVIGVKYNRITVRCQKTKWGSCSSAGNLNFNCLLMLCPPEVRDYIVVHELCHRKRMDHSPAFWAEVARILPDYKTREAWLKANGASVLRRMTG